jgi:hypothetical protein
MASLGAGGERLQLPARRRQIRLDHGNVLCATGEIAAAREFLSGAARVEYGQCTELPGAGLQSVQSSPERSGISAVEGFARFSRFRGRVLEEQFDHAAHELGATESHQALQRIRIENGRFSQLLLVLLG